MNNDEQTHSETAPGMTVGDIYYILFRRKWMILVLALAGILSAAAVYFFAPPPYQSVAELLIQYVPQAGSLPVMGSDQKVIMPDSRGADIINSEIQIMTSQDLAQQAVTNFGASAILARAGGGSDPNRAAGIVARNFTAEPASKSAGGGGSSCIIVVSFKHPDPGIVQPVLRELVNDYLQKQKEIHSAGGQFDDALSREESALNAQLNDTEQQLAALKNKANIVSLEDDRKDLADQIARIQGSIMDAEAELAGLQGAMKVGSGSAPVQIQTVTNVAPPVPADQLEAYNTLCANLEALRKKEQDYFLQGFTKSNLLVQAVEEQINGAKRGRSELQKEFPQIVTEAAATHANGGSTTSALADPPSQAALMATLQSKITAWEAQLATVRSAATNLNGVAPAIVQLEQTKAIQEANFQNLATGIEKSHIDQALDAGNAPNNIKWVQYPSSPFQDWRKNQKIMAMLAFGGIAAGLAWAFLMELVLDRSVRRPSEIVAKLKLPLFLSIPDVTRNGHARLAPSATVKLLHPPAGISGMASLNGDGNGARSHNGDPLLVSHEHNPALYPFCEALRDRLIVYFEVRNLTHKPKLVAVTSASRGVGVSTVAAGLAASLSETGDGNVLLVDMNLEQGAVQQFYKGKIDCGLDAALKPETKEGAMVRENLYVVNGNANSAELPRILPKRFSALVPRLKASEYDYIIFDMPPVSQTSLTSRLARFMDMVLLVVESEKCSCDVVRQANGWLAESGATVGAVFNKTREYVPKRLHREFLADR